MQASNSNTLTMKRRKQATVDNTLNDIPTNSERHHDHDDEDLAVATVDKHGKVKLRVAQHLRPHITRKFLNNSQRNFTSALQEALTGIQLVDHSAGLADTKHAFEHDCVNASLSNSRSTRSGRIPPRRGRPGHVPSSANQCSTHLCDLGFDDLDADATDDEIRRLPPRALPKITKMKSVSIASEDQVKAFLLDRLDRIQQLSDKKIAKAWIKGICPKKQAEYPYQNKRSPGADILLPPFWPLDVKYKEPDHIQKEDRNKLLLHLIRLRPSPEEVRRWNRDQVSLNKTHQTVGWTAFLRELAPPECVDDIDNVKPEKVKKRKEYMKQMYEVALREEEYRCFGMGDDTLKYSYPDDDKPVKRYTARQKKRSRSPASSTDDDSRTHSRSSSESRMDRPLAKRPCKESDAKPAVQASLAGVVSGGADDVGALDTARLGHDTCLPPTVDQKVVASQNEETHCAVKVGSSLPTDAEWLASREEVAAMHQAHISAPITNDRQHPEQRREEDHQQQQLCQWQTASPATMSFGSASEPSTPPSFDVYSAQTGQSMFPGTHDFQFDLSEGPHKSQQRPTSNPHQHFHEQLQEHHSHPLHAHHHHLGIQHPPMSEAYPVLDVPHPTFDPAPGTPLFSPAGMFPHNMPMSVSHEVASVPAHLHVQHPPIPPQAQPAQQQVYSPMYDSPQFHYPSPDHHRQIYAPTAQPYESYHPPLQHGLPLQPPHGVPPHFMSTNLGYLPHH